MKKNLFIFVAALSLLSVLLISCSPVALTADQIIQKMAENGKNLKTGRVQMDLSMSVGGQTMKISSAGVFENPGKSYSTVTAEGQSMQVLSLSLTEVYQRASDKDKWVKSNTSASEQTGAMFDFTKDPEQLLKYYSNTKLLPEENMDGNVPCFHVSFDLDVAGIMKSAGIDATILQAIVFKGPAKVEAWIGKTDFFTRKQTSKFTMTANAQEVPIDVLVTQTEINKPVVIPTP